MDLEVLRIKIMNPGLFTDGLLSGNPSILYRSSCGSEWTVQLEMVITSYHGLDLKLLHYL